ncbi:hypothetical protein BLOT_013509 [Blomia tropicalis]|nr:hypothetical protein BLOT_013509 [Blomia tropicalis]
MKRMINGFVGKLEDLIGIHNPILEQILMMVFTIRKICDWYSIRSQQHAKQQKMQVCYKQASSVIQSINRRCKALIC